MWPLGAFSRLSPRQLEIDAPGAPYGERRHSAGGLLFLFTPSPHTHGLPCLGRGRRGAPFSFVATGRCWLLGAFAPLRCLVVEMLNSLSSQRTNASTTQRAEGLNNSTGRRPQHLNGAFHFSFLAVSSLYRFIRCATMVGSVASAGRP